MNHRQFFRWIVLPALLVTLLFGLGCAVLPNANSRNRPSQGWIAESNKLASQYSLAWAEVFPEQGSELGYREYDARVTRNDDELEGRVETLLNTWRLKLANLNRNESRDLHPEVKVDVRVLIETVDEWMHRRDLEKKYGEVDFDEIADGIFYSLRTLTNEQNPMDRKRAAVDRFRKYVRGFSEDGKTGLPRAEASRRRTEKKLHLYSMKSGPSKGRTLFPLRAEVENYLKNSQKVVEGIGHVLGESGRDDWNDDFKIFKEQMTDYDRWLRHMILPRSRKDHRLPREIYAWNLRKMGLRGTPEEIRKTARQAFVGGLTEYRKLAQEIAKRDNLKDPSPKAVLAYLKKNVETNPDKIRARYEKANIELSADIKKRDLVSLPEIPLRIRVASEAESRIQPVPHLDTPQLIGNTGQRPEFVVPVGSADKLAFDDFAFEAAAKSLTAHEGRPGHDLQFSAIIDRGVSMIRANYAFNSVNVEGWALYAEWLMEPSLSLDERMALLMSRMMRNARMFLDPEIQMGLITPKAAKRVITEEIGMSPQWADLELQRYMYKSPAQAPSYYFGYLKLREIREAAIKRLGVSFRERCFHDAILNEGLLPLEILAEKMSVLNCP